LTNTCPLLYNGYVFNFFREIEYMVKFLDFGSRTSLCPLSLLKEHNPLSQLADEAPF